MLSRVEPSLLYGENNERQNNCNRAESEKAFRKNRKAEEYFVEL